MGKTDHEIDFGDVEIVKSPKTVQSVLDGEGQEAGVFGALCEPATLTPCVACCTLATLSTRPMRWV